MFQFRGKTVFIISPERWGVMKVSKHHYALELAEIDCRVFFIEPPDLNATGIIITNCPDHPNIKQVRYKPVFRGSRFLPDVIFSFLVKLQVKKLIRKIGVKPDVIFCFQGYLFQNLKWFGAGLTIFFAADQFYYHYLPREAASADLLISVSDTITAKLKTTGKQVHQLGHGLQKSFVQHAEELLKCTNQDSPPQQIIVGYTGNLKMEALDRHIMREVINANPDVTFIFWGSYKKNDLNLGGIHNIEADAFIQFLESKENVQLRGAVSGNQLLQEMKICNLFWICWKIGVNNLWDGSNSHKILEYFATGRPVVSHHVSSYKDSGLLYMLPEKINTGYPKLFSDTIQVVKKGEQQHLIHQRLTMAVKSAYANKLKMIESLVGYG